MDGSMRGTVSVDDRMANIPFASYLRDRINNQSNLPCREFQAGPPPPLPLQTINKPQGIQGGQYFPLFRPVVLHTPFDRHPLPVSQPNMTAQAPTYFKDYIHDPHGLYLPTNVAVAQNGYQQPPAYSSLWTTGTAQPTYAGTKPPTPIYKMDNSPFLPTPSVLPGEVDASKYENVPYTDWYNAPTLYNSTSPSSLDHDSNSPATPEEMFADFCSGSGLYSNLSTQGYPGGSSELHFHSKGMTDMTLCNKFAPQSTDRGLPSGNHLLSTSPQEHLGQAQFYHHHHMAEGNLSSGGSEVNSPVESQDVDDEDSFDSPHAVTYALAAGEADTRKQRDQLLLTMRNEGLPYRDIKRLGGFKEAESTLRGRYRTLTKEKEERVRKPKWQQHDETLLRQAVKHYTNGSKNKPRMKCGRRKLPWKKISQWMKDHGSSYHFAPATCAKKWESLRKAANSDHRRDT